DVLRGDATIAHVARHLLAFEGLARILALTGRTDRAVGHRHTVRSTQTTEIPALHTAGEALTDRSTGDVHQLAFEEVVSLQRGTDLDEVGFVNAEFGDMTLGLDLGNGELAALSLGGVLGLSLAC